MPHRPFFPLPKVSVDHVALAHDIAQRVEEVVVDQSLLVPDMFEVVFHDTSGTTLADARLHIGSEVKVECLTGDDHGGVLIQGEVTALEARLGEDGVKAVARGYDKSHRLHGGRTTKAYKNAKISDVATQIAQAAGLQIGHVSDSGTVHDVVSQHNQTHWEFLQDHAAELGWEVLVEEGKFHFRQPAQSGDAPEPADWGGHNPNTLVWGEDLLSFHPRVSATQQVSTVETRAWDPENKQALVGTASADADHATLSADPGGLAGMVGGGTFTHVSSPHGVQAPVDKEASAIAQKLGSTFAEADGISVGTPKVRAGAKIAISRVGADFTGKYTITSARHTFDQYDGYLTHFTISGRQDRTLLGLTSGAARPAPDFHGVVCAQVTDNNDPDKKGRVKLKFPWLSADYETDWVRMAHPGAGPSSGMVWVPEVDDEVLVAFEHGDMRRPHVISSLHNGQDTPLLGNGLVDNGKVKRRGMVSRKGHKLLLFDDDNKSGISLMSSDGNLKISLNETNGEIKIYCSKKVTIKTDSDKISVEAGGDMDLKATGNLTLSGQGVKIQAQGGNVEVTGTQIKLN